MAEALRVRQKNMDHMNDKFRDMTIESRQAGVNIPDHVQHKVDTLNADWRKIKQMAANLRPSSDSSLEDTVFVEGGSLMLNTGNSYYHYPLFSIA